MTGVKNAPQKETCHPKMASLFASSGNLLSVHDFMARSNEIYYGEGGGHPLGKEGDFITAPMISPVFGEIIGLSLLDAWQRLGSWPRFTLLELGPGQGTLMRDILTITKGYPLFHQAMDLVFLEINPDFSFPHPHQHFQTIETLKLEKQPVIMVANEFFDALPVRQWRQDQTGQEEERTVQWTDQGLRFSFPDEACERETCPQGVAIFQKLVSHMAQWGGAGVILDYGDAGENRKGSTLQGVHRHQPCHPLDRPGYQDLTAWVAFDELMAVLDAHTPISHHYETQRSFLIHRGIWVRLQQILHGLENPQEQKDHTLAVDRLIHPQGMGQLFKALWFEKGI